MSSILTSDIFFFVTTLAVIIVTAVIVLVGYHAYRIVKKVEGMTDRVVLGFSTFEEFIKKLPFLRDVISTKRKTRRTHTKEDA